MPMDYVQVVQSPGTNKNGICGRPCMCIIFLTLRLGCYHKCWIYVSVNLKMYFLQVNNNGVISFTTTVSQYTSSPFPLSGNLQLVAPYWGDVDTRGTGTVWYREITDMGSPLLANVSDLIRSAFVGQQTFVPTSLFIATWDHVGYFISRTDKVAI